MGAGTIYTVVSDTSTATAAQLRAATAPPGGPSGRHAAQPGQADPLPPAPPPLPAGGGPRPPDHGRAPRPRDRPPTTRWRPSRRGWPAHIRYTTDIPPLAPGADAVTSFLFGTRQGFCEQISTATVVMLRSLGIPAREAVGYVPGSYNPITDLYDVQAKDAHAWVQVWFPGYGWQNFDPTAEVPAGQPVARLGAGPHRRTRPGATALDSHRRGGRRGGAGRRASAGGGGAARPPGPTRSPPTSSGAGRGGRLDRRPDETLIGLRPTGWPTAAIADGTDAGRRSPRLVERYSYGGIEPSAERDRRRPGLHPPVPTGPAATAGARPAARLRTRDRPAPRRTRRRRPAAAGRP